MLHNIFARPVARLTNEAVIWYYQPKKFRRMVLLAGLCVIFLIIILLHRHHSSNSTPQWLDKVHKSLKKTDLNIAVVEEHHEVIQYWLTAAQKGLIGYTGNILVHIDAHPDSGLPAEVPGFARFKAPNTSKQIHMLMQRNDVFIMAAMYKDYLKEFIWIHPDWVEMEDFDEKSLRGEKMTVSLGLYMVMMEGELFKGLCSCYSGEDVCDFTDPSGLPLQGFKAKCELVKEVSVYMIKESQASRLLPAILARLDSSIVLDIDEDYYGVMKGSDLLQGINFTYIESFNDVLSSTFSVKNVQDESNAHTLMLNILHMVKVTCSATREETRDCSDVQFRKIQKFLMESGLEQTPIGGIKITQKELKGLVEFISSTFTAQHLDQISQLGFCLKISPLTYKVEKDTENWHGYEELSVCHGINTPDSDNQIHVPKSKDIPPTTDRFTNLLKLIPVEDVKLVTLCRSNRDGFVPRHLQQDIEKDILKSLRGKFTNSHIIYDPNLMTHLGQGIR